MLPNLRVHNIASMEPASEARGGLVLSRDQMLRFVDSMVGDNAGVDELAGLPGVFP